MPNTLKPGLVGVRAFCLTTALGVIVYSQNVVSVVRSAAGIYDVTVLPTQGRDILTEATAFVTIRETIGGGPWSIEQISTTVYRVHTHAFTGADQDRAFWFVLEDL